jgi:hypothetical protein
MAERSWTTPQLAARWRVSQEKILRWIRLRLLRAINTATDLAGRPRYIITPEALRAFEEARSSKPAPKAQRRRRRVLVDFFPDL